MTVGGDTRTHRSRSLLDTEWLRRRAYGIAVTVILVTWTTYMILSNSWHYFSEYWSASVTMILGSFVAGATAEGGAAVAFPVFTKVLGIEPETARTFGLMIQSVGMTMAALVIVVRRIPILPRVVFWVSLGGIAGQFIGAYWIAIGSPDSKILFTFIAAVFGAAVVVSRWGFDLPTIERLPTWRLNDKIFYTAIGVVGGTFAANTGSGIDMVTFIVLTLAIGINEKVSTPTTVVIMGLNSVVGFAIRGLLIGDVDAAFPYWIVSVPVVIFGAPLGAYVASKATRDHIIILLVSLISLELVTTLLLVPFSPEARRVAVIAVLASILWFLAMLTYRVTHIVPSLAALEEASWQDDQTAKSQDDPPVEFAAVDTSDGGNRELGET
ncbi:MAG: sulfite exporter TauE/SafE family protein [Acidimicrobiia bacterium]|nr:sulfite exporter TauE/SafE family protein [Acidimicrobiia bacterium]